MTTRTESATIITFTAVDYGGFGKRWCDLCGGRADPGYGESLYTFTDPLQTPGSSRGSDACHQCAHAGTDGLRAIAFEHADRLEAHAAELRRQADELIAEAPKVRQIMGTANYMTVETDGWDDAAYDQLAEQMRTAAGGLSWKEERHLRANLGLPPTWDEPHDHEPALVAALARYDESTR